MESVARKKKIIFSWSGGRDSALALGEILEDTSYEVSALLTTIEEEHDTVSMHGTRRILIVEQAASLGIPLEEIFLPKNISRKDYESKMQSVLEKYSATGISSVGFGDIFLEDLRKYRENNLSKIGMKGVFPIWKRDTGELTRTFIESGFKAVITCVDSSVLREAFVGRQFDERFLSELPRGIDPSGENGEFHSFVYDGPIFQKPIPYKKGKTVSRENRFYCCDLAPVREKASPLPEILC